MTTRSPSASLLLTACALLGACQSSGAPELVARPPPARGVVDDGSAKTPLGEADHELDARAIADIEAAADRAIVAGIPGLSVAIQRGSQTVTILRGVSDLATGAPIGSEHRFRMASIAKSMVASVILQLVDEGIGSPAEARGAPSRS